jgi:putative methyltransferase
MKIKFLANYPPNGGTPASLASGSGAHKFSINPSYFYLKHYYDLHGQTPNVKWLLGDLFLLDEFDVIISNIERDSPDILGLSVFIWNEQLQHNIAKAIKSRFPNIVIVTGGPHLCAHKDPTYFNTHPYIDYVVYGDGEKAFQQLIDYHSGQCTDKSQWINIVEKNGKVHPFEQLTDEEYFTTSAILNQKEFVLDHIKYLEDRGGNKRDMIFGVEFARGCMYGCTFCDWGQNLTKKVKRRSFDWKSEVDFFHHHNIAIRETDANFGQWDEDLEIFRYATSLYDPNRNFYFYVVNTPKLKKKNTLEILKTNAEIFNQFMKVSLQDINENVLQLMDRPSLSWKDHVDMVNQIRSQLDPKHHDKFLAELMVGVAGQTYDGFAESVFKIISDANINRFFFNHWMYLPNSPGADPMYQRMHKIKWIKGYTIDKGLSIPNVTSLKEVYEHIKQTPGLVQNTKESTLVYSTSTMTFVEMLAIHILQSYLQTAATKFGPLGNLPAFPKMFETFKKKSLMDAQRQYAEIAPLIEQYGFVVFGSYLPDKNQVHYRWIP